MNITIYLNKRNTELIALEPNKSGLINRLLTEHYSKTKVKLVTGYSADPAASGGDKVHIPFLDSYSSDIKNNSVGKPTKPEGMSNSEWDEQTRVNVEANMKYDAIRKSLRGNSVTDIKDLLETTPARIKNDDTPFRNSEEWQEAEAQEKPCCLKAKPCQHWIFDGDTQIWQNTISGRQREVS